jgi:hypothetical protein
MSDKKSRVVLSPEEFAKIAGPFGTLEEAKAALPSGSKLKAFKISRKDGSVLWTNASGHVKALAYVAKADGYACTMSGKVATQEDVDAETPPAPLPPRRIVQATSPGDDRVYVSLP